MTSKIQHSKSVKYPKNQSARVILIQRDERIFTLIKLPSYSNFDSHRLYPQRGEKALYLKAPIQVHT